MKPTESFVGVWAVEGIALFLINDANKSTKALVSYCDTEPVRIRFKRQSANPMMLEVA